MRKLLLLLIPFCLFFGGCQETIDRAMTSSFVHNAEKLFGQADVFISKLSREEQFTLIALFLLALLLTILVLKAVLKVLKWMFRDLPAKQREKQAKKEEKERREQMAERRREKELVRGIVSKIDQNNPDLVEESEKRVITKILLFLIRKKGADVYFPSDLDQALEELEKSSFEANMAEAVKNLKYKAKQSEVTLYDDDINAIKNMAQTVSGSLGALEKKAKSFVGRKEIRYGTVSEFVRKVNSELSTLVDLMDKQTLLADSIDQELDHIISMRDKAIVSEEFTGASDHNRSALGKDKNETVVALMNELTEKMKSVKETYEEAGDKTAG